MAVLERGKVIEEGEVIDVFLDPQQELTKRFIRTVIDYSLPEGLEDMVIKGDLVRVTFKGESTHQPFMSMLVKKYQIDANILYGRIDDIQGIPFGTLILELIPNGGSINTALNFLEEQGLVIEVLKNG